jgi:hypothetical protein
MTRKGLYVRAKVHCYEKGTSSRLTGHCPVCFTGADMVHKRVPVHKWITDHPFKDLLSLRILQVGPPAREPLTSLPGNTKPTGANSSCHQIREEQPLPPSSPTAAAVLPNTNRRLPPQQRRRRGGWSWERRHGEHFGSHGPTE